MYCKDCRYWKPITYLAGSDEKAGGNCVSNFLTENYGIYKEDSLVYEYSEGGSFWTGAKFGCVNFEEK